MNRTKKIILIVAIALIVFVAGIALFLFLTFKTNFWLKYPNPFKTQVAFSRLEMSSYDSLCHEDCMMEQNMLRKMIANYLVEEPVAMSGQVEDYITSDKVDINFKRSLLMILMDAEKIKQEKDSSYEIKAPRYLKVYLNNQNRDINLKRDIMATFEEQIGLSAGFLDALVKIIENNSKSVEERVEAINDLISIIGKEDENVSQTEGVSPKYPNIKYSYIHDVLFDIAENNESDKIKKTAQEGVEVCKKFGFTTN